MQQRLKYLERLAQRCIVLNQGWTYPFNAFRPASFMSPRCSSSAQRCLFSSVQWLFFRLGESRCAFLPSGRRFIVLSIHPKHSASSTTCRYGIQSVRGILVRYIVTQHSFAVAWFFASHSLNCVRSVNSNNSVISICSACYRICAVWFLVSTFSMTRSKMPFSSKMKVLRSVPMEDLPYSFFSPHAPKACSI